MQSTRAPISLARSTLMQHRSKKRPCHGQRSSKGTKRNSKNPQRLPPPPAAPPPPPLPPAPMDRPPGHAIRIPPRPAPSQTAAPLPLVTLGQEPPGPDVPTQPAPSAATAPQHDEAEDGNTELSDMEESLEELMQSVTHEEEREDPQDNATSHPLPPLSPLAIEAGVTAPAVRATHATPARPGAAAATEARGAAHAAPRISEDTTSRWAGKTFCKRVGQQLCRDSKQQCGLCEVQNGADGLVLCAIEGCGRRFCSKCIRSGLAADKAALASGQAQAIQGFRKRSQSLSWTCPSCPPLPHAPNGNLIGPGVPFMVEQRSLAPREQPPSPQPTQNTAPQRPDNDRLRRSTRARGHA